MRKPERPCVKVRVEIKFRLLAALRVSPHWAGWALLMIYLLAHGQGHLPVHWAA